MCNCSLNYSFYNEYIASLHACRVHCANYVICRKDYTHFITGSYMFNVVTHLILTFYSKHFVYYYYSSGILIYIHICKPKGMGLTLEPTQQLPLPDKCFWINITNRTHNY